MRIISLRKTEISINKYLFTINVINKDKYVDPISKNNFGWVQEIDELNYINFLKKISLEEWISSIKSIYCNHYRLLHNKKTIN